SPLAMARPAIPPSPLRDRVGYSDHDRFRGYLPVHCRSGLQPPCLRFAMAVTGHHARLGTRLLARLCRGRHLRRLSSTRLQGATPTEPRFTLEDEEAEQTSLIDLLLLALRRVCETLSFDDANSEAPWMLQSPNQEDAAPQGALRQRMMFIPYKAA